MNSDWNLDIFVKCFILVKTCISCYSHTDLRIFRNTRTLINFNLSTQFIFNGMEKTVCNGRYISFNDGIIYTLEISNYS